MCRLKKFVEMGIETPSSCSRFLLRLEPRGKGDFRLISAKHEIGWRPAIAVWIQQKNYLQSTFNSNGSSSFKSITYLGFIETAHN